MKKYEFTNKTITHAGRELKQIRRISDGLVGGYIESERNLSQNGNAGVCGNARVSVDALVYGNANVCGNACVSGNARVSDDARVYGNAKVFGNAKVTKLVLTATLPRHNITLTDNHIAIGCECHTIKHWVKHIDSIGANNAYKAEEIKFVKRLLNSLLGLRKCYENRG